MKYHLESVKARLKVKTKRVSLQLINKKYHQDLKKGLIIPCEIYNHGVKRQTNYFMAYARGYRRALKDEAEIKASRER